MDFGDNPLIKLLEKLMGLPGMRVNRTSLLCETYHLSKTDIESKDVSELISLEQMDSAAKKFITKNVTQSSMAAFGLGLPGGFAMALTIPADIMQGFGFSLRLAQQLAYLYGFEDLFADGGRMTAKTRNTLVAFLGIMFAASGSGTVLRAIAPNIGKFAAKQVMSKPLTKSVWFPMLKKSPISSP
ncbi:MAG: EcsC family protein, partial [Eggerthellaceae bacterium]|nr:EcsC family protein [Eggerthellaceae bacterium]